MMIVLKVMMVDVAGAIGSDRAIFDDGGIFFAVV